MMQDCPQDCHKSIGMSRKREKEDGNDGKSKLAKLAESVSTPL